jgi:hypothetical protein
VLVQEEISYLQDAVEASIKRKTCKQHYIRAEESLIVSKVANLIAKKEGRGYIKSKTPAKRVRRQQRCRRYSKIRHNFCTCKVEIEDVDNSNASK